MAWSVVTTNRTPVTDSPGAIGWRRGAYGRRSRCNAGGGKAPQFKADVASGEASEIGATLATPEMVRTLRKTSHAEAKDAPGSYSGKPTSAHAVEVAVMRGRPTGLYRTGTTALCGRSLV